MKTFQKPLVVVLILIVLLIGWWWYSLYRPFNMAFQETGGNLNDMIASDPASFWESVGMELKSFLSPSDLLVKSGNGAWLVLLTACGIGGFYLWRATRAESSLRYLPIMPLALLPTIAALTYFPLHIHYNRMLLLEHGLTHPSALGAGATEPLSTVVIGMLASFVLAAVAMPAAVILSRRETNHGA